MYDGEIEKYVYDSALNSDDWMSSFSAADSHLFSKINNEPTESNICQNLLLNKRCPINMIKGITFNHVAWYTLQNLLNN